MAWAQGRNFGAEAIGNIEIEIAGEACTGGRVNLSAVADLRQGSALSVGVEVETIETLNALATDDIGSRAVGRQLRTSAIYVHKIAQPASVAAIRWLRRPPQAIWVGQNTDSAIFDWKTHLTLLAVACSALPAVDVNAAAINDNQILIIAQ